MYGSPPLTDYEKAALSVTAKAATQGRVVKYRTNRVCSTYVNYTSESMNRLDATLKRYADDTRKLEDIETLGMF